MKVDCKLLCLILMLGNFTVALAQQTTQNNELTPGTPAYQTAKSNGTLSSAITPIIQTTKAPPFDQVLSQNDGNRDNCYIAHDPLTWTNIPANDDGSTAVISLPFTFNFYGTEYTEIYINNNGNITFDESVSAYTASGFPITTPMIAPFWADVDTRGEMSDLAWYMITPTAVYLNYPGVGYYASHDDKLNTFQVIITNGLDPVIGIGNNVAFYYEDMQWTTGDASDGINGFDGVSSTVGANSGDGTNFFQIGRFNQPGDEFLGAYVEGSGVDWLDNECFVFNVNSNSNANIPPILQDISENSLQICEGDSAIIEWTFTGPESDQVVDVVLEDLNSTGSYLSSIMTNPGSTSGNLTVFGGGPGDFILTLIATDDSDTSETTTVNIDVMVNTCADFDCPDQQANLGDTCNDENPETENDVIIIDCVCAGTPIMYDCPQMSANIGDDCGENGIVSENCECIETPEDGCFASVVIEYNPGLTASNEVIDPIRTNPDNALGDPERDDTFNFTSLGYGGDITLSFDESVLNGDGDDIEVVETTFHNDGCDIYEESAEVMVSQNGVDWLYLGTTCQDGYFDISDADPTWTFINFIKIVDITSMESVSSDAYDVDGVVALNGCGTFEIVYECPELEANIGDECGEGGIVNENCECEEPDDTCTASEVIEYNPGLTSMGGVIDPIRTNSDNALGDPQRDDSYNFASLGYGGNIILGFGQSALNGPGDDIEVVETTFNNDVCDTYEESAEIFFSQDGIVWMSAGIVCQDAFFDISDVNPAWTYINFINIVDMTGEGSVSLDAYDVDGVVALNGCGEPEITTTVGECYAAEMFNYVEGTRSNTTALPANRIISDNALGAPQDDDTYNFVTLGYGGSITLGFNGAVLNGAGDDIQIFETSFGSPVCGAYNETADVSVSVDGFTYYEIGSVCLDGSVDISDAPLALEAIFFVRISNNDLSSNTDDGYDVDAVVAIHNCIDLGEGGPQTLAIQSNNYMTVGEDNNISLEAYPNPTKGETVISFSVPTNTFTSVDVYNMEGKNIATVFAQQAEADNVYRLEFNGNDLPNGIYVYRLTTETTSVIEKFMIAK